MKGRIRQALVLAAGEGTRLRPLTADRPKPMLPIGGKPVLEHIVNWLRLYGVDQIAINLHHRPEIVTHHFGDGKRFGVSIHYSIEETLLGSAGAAKKLADYWQSSLVVAYGDVITDLDLGSLIAFHRSNAEKVAGGKPAVTMVVYQVPSPWECSIVELCDDARITRFVEKPTRDAIFSNLANSGIMVVDPGVLDLVPSGVFFDFGSDLFPLLLERGLPIFGRAIVAGEYLLDMGSVDKYRQAEDDWRSGRFRPVAQSAF